jgi:hypothetical protein
LASTYGNNLKRYSGVGAPSRKFSKETEDHDILNNIHFLETNHNFTQPTLSEPCRTNPTSGSETMYYPILFVSISELINLSEALIYLYCHFHRNIAVVFVPDFVLGTLITEIKKGLDQGRSPSGHSPKPGAIDESRTSNLPPASSEKQRNSGGPKDFNDRKSYIKEKQEQLLTAYKQDTNRKSSNSYQPPSTTPSAKISLRNPLKINIPKKESAQPVSAVLSKTEIPEPKPELANSDVIWTYQIILQSIEKVQKEHAVSISIFI